MSAIFKAFLKSLLSEKAIVKKRPILLLEILIALALIALCILPLITPHIAMIKEQKKFAAIIKLDHMVHHLYVDVLEQLQTNRISWKSIESKVNIPIDESMLERANSGQRIGGVAGHFHFEEIKKKTNKSSGWSAYLLKLSFHFDPIPSIGPKAHTFDYTVYLLRHLPADENADEEEIPQKEKKNVKKNKKENN